MIQVQEGQELAGQAHLPIEGEFDGLNFAILGQANSRTASKAASTVLFTRKVARLSQAQLGVPNFWKRFARAFAVMSEELHDEPQAEENPRYLPTLRSFANHHMVTLPYFYNSDNSAAPAPDTIRGLLRPG